MATQVDYRTLARRQGVERPFDILLRMPADSRWRLATLLGCDLGRCIHPPAQAWRIINQNLWGLQARTHYVFEQLSPFARNNNWWEILTRTARRAGVQFYPGVEEVELERMIFERFAATYLRERQPEDVEEVDAVGEEHPVLRHTLAALRLSRDATRSVLSALALSAVKADDGVREGCRILSEWVRIHMSWSWSLTLPKGVGLLQQRLGDVFASWTVRRQSEQAWERVGVAVAIIHFQDTVDRAVEEFCA